MSLKYSNTTADYLVWSEAMNLIRKLAKDENYKMSLFIALGSPPCWRGKAHAWHTTTVCSIF